MMLLVCYYPKMWFYLQLKIVFTLSSFGLVKSTILFLCSFQGTFEFTLFGVPSKLDNAMPNDPTWI